MKFKRLATVAASILALAMLVAACGGGGSGTSASTTAPPATSAAADGATQTTAATQPEPPAELSWTVYVPNFGTAAEGTAVQTEWLKRMESYMGAKLNLQWTYVAWADYQERENLIMQSGDISDISTNSRDGVPNQFSNLLLDLDPYLKNGDAPNYSRFLEETPEGRNIAYNLDGGTYYFLDGLINPDNIEGAQSFAAFGYRFDAFKANGIDIPGTLDELYEAAVKLKALYPDSYVFGNSNQGWEISRGFAGIYHTSETLFYDGKEFRFGPVTDDYREMVRYIAKLYADGMLDPEFATDDNDRMKEKALTGRVLVMPNWWAGNPATWNTEVDKSLYPDIEWGNAYLPSAEGYGTPWKWGSYKPGRSVQKRFGIMLKNGIANPELAVKMIDYQYSDEMCELVNWGIEGVTYTKDANGDNIYNDEIMNSTQRAQAMANYGISASMGCRVGIPFTPQDFNTLIVQAAEEPWWDGSGYVQNKYWLATDEYGGPDSVAPFSREPALLLTSDEAGDRATETTACVNFAKTALVEFITGVRDIETGWDQYVQEVLASGEIERVIGMLNGKLAEQA